VVVRKFVAALAVSTALILGTSGCSLTDNIATQQPYAPSVGTEAMVDGVKALNIIYLTEATKGAAAVEIGGLIGSFVNTSDEPIQVFLQFESDGSSSPDVITSQTRDWVSDFIAPGEKFDLGYNGNSALAALLLNSGKVTKPGDVVKVWFSVNDGTATELRVPALDGSLEQYAPLIEQLTVVPEVMQE
jgi:hypothetical protein